MGEKKDGQASAPPSPKAELEETLSSTQSKAHIESAQKLLDEERGKSDPPDPDEPESRPSKSEEVAEAAETLTGAVDQMVPSLLLSIGMLDTAIKWLKGIAACMAVAFLIAVFIAVRIEKATSTTEAASKEVAAARGQLTKANEELDRANKELGDIRADLRNLKAEMAKQAVDQASQPKIVAGDRPGEVAIVTPAINQKDIEKAKKAAEKAVKEGKEPPPLPTAAKATKIPAQLKPGEVEELDKALE